MLRHNAHRNNPCYTEVCSVCSADDWEGLDEYRAAQRTLKAAGTPYHEETGWNAAIGRYRELYTVNE